MRSIWFINVHDYVELLFKRTTSGFETFYLTYYKTVTVGWEIKYAVRTIGMEPWHGVVAWGGTETCTVPLWEAWHRINLTNFKRPAEAALQIAEKNGGKEARSQNANKCGIYVSRPDNDTWQLDYTSDANFTMLINPYTGSYKTFLSK